MRQRTLALIGAVLVLLGLAVPMSTPAGSGLRAELDGQRIPLSDVGPYHCHDGRYPVISCFHTEGQVPLDLTQIEAGRDGPQGLP